MTGCLRVVLSNPLIGCIIPGIRNADEVRQNVRVGEEFQPMTDAERRELMAMIGSRREAFRYGQVCLQCGYCQPCPEGVNIPAIFRAQMVVESYSDALKPMGYEAYESLEVKADGCVECRECVEECPAGIDIPERLKQAAEVLKKA